jgi:hypothetical protein
MLNIKVYIVAGVCTKLYDRIDSRGMNFNEGYQSESASPVVNNIKQMPSHGAEQLNVIFDSLLSMSFNG